MSDTESEDLDVPEVLAEALEKQVFIINETIGLVSTEQCGDDTLLKQLEKIRLKLVEEAVRNALRPYTKARQPGEQLPDSNGARGPDTSPAQAPGPVA